MRLRFQLAVNLWQRLSRRAVEKLTDWSERFRIVCAPVSSDANAYSFVGVHPLSKHSRVLGASPRKRKARCGPFPRATGRTANCATATWATPRLSVTVSALPSRLKTLRSTYRKRFTFSESGALVHRCQGKQTTTVGSPATDSLRQGGPQPLGVRYL